MPTVAELADLYAHVLVTPAPGSGVCSRCLTFTERYDECYVCSTTPPWLDAVVPISYSVAHEQLHHALASYKRLTGDVARRLQVALAAILWRFLDAHEECVARRAAVEHFDVVTTVPPGSVSADGPPLRRIVAELCGATRERFVPALARADGGRGGHEFDPDRFIGATRLVDGARVLLIDDTWTTGANAQSAAAALKRAGARRVGAVVIGRHLKRDWQDNDRRLRSLPRPFDWTTCAACQTAALGSSRLCRRQ